MAQNDTIPCPADTWTQLTNADATAVRVQDWGGVPIFIQATSGATAPTSSDGAIVMQPEALIPATFVLADLFPGVSSAARLWAKPIAQATQVSVSHA